MLEKINLIIIILIFFLLYKIEKRKLYINSDKLEIQNLLRYIKVSDKILEKDNFMKKKIIIKNFYCIKIQGLKSFLIYQLEEFSYFKNKIEININSNINKINNNVFNDLLLEKIFIILYIMFNICKIEIINNNLKKIIMNIKLDNNHLKLELNHLILNSNIKRIDQYGIFAKKYKKTIKNILNLYPQLEIINYIDKNVYKEILLIQLPKIN